MSNTKTVAVAPLVIRRKYAAKRDRVWAAWTDPVQMRAWAGPEGMSVPDFQCDFTVGGSYRLTMQQTDGEKFIAKGVYREIHPPERLSYTWTWEEDSPEDEHETVVTIELRDLGSETELILTHEGLKSEESRESHNGGWNQMLEKFGKHLSQ